MADQLAVVPATGLTASDAERWAAALRADELAEPAR